MTSIQMKQVEGKYYLAIQGATPACTDFQLTLFNRLNIWSTRVSSDDVEEFRATYGHTEPKDVYFQKVIEALATDESKQFYTTLKMVDDNTRPAPMITIGFIDPQNNNMRLKMAVFKLVPESDDERWQDIMQTMLADRKRCKNLLAEKSQTVEQQKKILSSAYADVTKLTAEHVAHKSDLLVAFTEILDNKSDRILELEELLKQEKQRVATAQSRPSYPTLMPSQTANSSQLAAVEPSPGGSQSVTHWRNDSQSTATGQTQTQSHVTAPPRMRAGKGLKRRHPIAAFATNQKPKLSPAKRTMPPSLFGDSQEDL